VRACSLKASLTTHRPVTCLRIILGTRLCPATFPVSTTSGGYPHAARTSSLLPHLFRAPPRSTPKCRPDCRRIFSIICRCAPAVVPEFFKEVCANRTIIDCKEMNAALLDAPATTIVQTWINKLERTEDRCVEVREHSGQIIDF
jgi:hypothetical protein